MKKYYYVPCDGCGKFFLAKELIYYKDNCRPSKKGKMCFNCYHEFKRLLAKQI